jgi:hypothetical protein
MRRFIVVLVAMAAAVAFAPSAAQVRQAAPSCSSFRQVTFSDGAVACLDQLPVAGLRSRGGGPTVLEAADRRSIWSLALPTGACAAAHGFSAAYGTVSFSDAAMNESSRVRSEALQQCNAAPGSEARCGCSEVLNTGKSTFTRNEFLAIAAGQGVAASPPGNEVPAPVAAAEARPAVQPPATSTQQPPQQDRVATLEKELRELRERMQPQGASRPAAVARDRPRVRALVIGNGAYASFGKLPNPRNDAEAIAARFRRYGIEVELVLDAGRERIVQALNDYAKRAAGSDINILFYAGHGVQVEGTNYLVPTDLRADGVSPGYLKLNAISLNAVLDYMPAQTRLVFLDACRDNPVSRSLMATRGGGGVGLAPVSTTSGTLIAYATKDGSTAEDGAGRHSPYTAALLEHLDKPQDIAVVLRHVRQSVMRATSNRQEPWEYGSLVGDQLVLSDVAR